jgi:hypothetical protein
MSGTAHDKCAHCGRWYLIGGHDGVVPYSIKKGVIRWLCGLQTERECAPKWFEKYREWQRTR